MVEEGRQTQALKLPFPTGETNKIIAPMETIHREITHFSYLETWKQILKVRPAIVPGEEKSGWNICAGIAFSPQARLAQQSNARFCCPASAIQLELAGD